MIEEQTKSYFELAICKYYYALQNNDMRNQKCIFLINLENRVRST